MFAMFTHKDISASARKGGACLLSLAMACSLFAPARPAWAVDVETARTSLDAAERQMQEIVAEHDELVQQVEQSQQQIDETTDLAVEAQTAMLEGRETLGDMAASEYRNDSLGALMTMVFSSQSLEEFLRNIDYATAIMESASEEIKAQKERKEAFESAIGDLNRQRDEQQTRLDAVQQKKDEAQKVVDQANSVLVDAQSEEAQRLQALAEQAAQLETQKQTDQAQISDEWNTSDRDDSSSSAAEEPQASGGSSVQGSPSSNSSSQTGQSGGSQDVSGWSAGAASAYGGSSDPNTPNPGTTATGAVCDDNSMGVAIPSSWPNYSSYLGRTVEISYGGATVIATVNDVGSMGGGSRSLDLQPGVFKALGFSTCQDWGVRTVSYRFL